MAGDGEDNVGRVRTLPRALATSRASPARFRAPGGRGRSGEAESIIGLSRGAPCAANRRRWRRHYGGHAEEPREGFDPGFTGEMRGREGGQRRGRPLDHASTEGGDPAARGSEGRARRHGARGASALGRHRVDGKFANNPLASVFLFFSFKQQLLLFI